MKQMLCFLALFYQCNSFGMLATEKKIDALIKKQQNTLNTFGTEIEQDKNRIIQQYHTIWRMLLNRINALRNNPQGKMFNPPIPETLEELKDGIIMMIGMRQRLLQNTVPIPLYT